MGRTKKATELTWLGRCGVEQYAIYSRSLRFPALAWQALLVAMRRSLLVYHVQGIELEVVAVVEPGAGEVKEAQAGASGERQGIDHELGDGTLMDGARFIVEDVDTAVADLQNINVAGDRPSGYERNVKAELLLHVCDVSWCQVDRHLHGNGDGIGQEHEALELVVPALVVGDGLEGKVRNARRKVLLLHDLDTVEVEGIGGLRGTMLFLEERVRTGSGHLGKVRCNGAEGLVLLFGEDEGELAFVDTVGIHLLVM